MDDNEQFQKKLIQILLEERKKRGMSHDMIANKAGISRQTLGKIENGQTNPTMLTMFKIVSAMEIRLQDFVKKMKV